MCLQLVSTLYLLLRFSDQILEVFHGVLFCGALVHYAYIKTVQR